MRKYLNYFQFVLTFTLVWIILNEKLDWVQISTGIIVSILSIFFTNYYLLFDDYTISYSMKFSTIIKYSVYLIIQIYKSGITSIGKVINGDGTVKIIEYETSIDDDLSICLLCHAITLTPGTVTIDKSDNKLKILSFDDNSDFDNATNNSSCSKFEDILKRR